MLTEQFTLSYMNMIYNEEEPLLSKYIEEVNTYGGTKTLIVDHHSEKWFAKHKNDKYKTLVHPYYYLISRGSTIVLKFNNTDRLHPALYSYDMSLPPSPEVVDILHGFGLYTLDSKIALLHALHPEYILG